MHCNREESLNSRQGYITDAKDAVETEVTSENSICAEFVSENSLKKVKSQDLQNHLGSRAEP